MTNMFDPDEDRHINQAVIAELEDLLEALVRTPRAERAMGVVIARLETLRGRVGSGQDFPKLTKVKLTDSEKWAIWSKTTPSMGQSSPTLMTEEELNIWQSKAQPPTDVKACEFSWVGLSHGHQHRCRREGEHTIHYCVSCVATRTTDANACGFEWSTTKFNHVCRMTDAHSTHICECNEQLSPTESTCDHAWVDYSEREPQCEHICKVVPNHLNHRCAKCLREIPTDEPLEPLCGFKWRWGGHAELIIHEHVCCVVGDHLQHLCGVDGCALLHQEEPEPEFACNHIWKTRRDGVFHVCRMPLGHERDAHLCKNCTQTKKARK